MSRKVSCGLGPHLLYCKYTIEFHIGDVGGIYISTPGLVQMKKCVAIATELNQITLCNLREKVTPDLIAHVPPEEIVHFRVDGDPMPMEDMSTKFSYLRALCFKRTRLTSYSGNLPLIGTVKYPLLSNTLFWTRWLCITVI